MRKIVKYFSLFLFMALIICLWGCQPKETYTPPKNVDQYKDVGLNERKTKPKDKEEQQEQSKKNPMEAIETLEKSWSEDWGDTQKNLRKGIDYFHVELYDNAQAEFEKAIKYDPEFAPAYIEIGRTYLKKELPYLAEESLKKATIIDPSLPRAFYYLAVTYCHLWQIKNNPEYKDMANKNIQTALSLKPDIPDPEDILDGDCIKPMEIDFYTILIKSEPSEATAYLGDTELGTTPITIKTNLDKIHDINGKKPGYKMLRKRVLLGEEQTATLTIEMKSEYDTTSVELSAAEKAGLVLEHDVIYFDLDKATIRTESYPVLDKIGPEILQFPQGKISIEGYTCDIGPDVYNLDLSQRRAQAVADYLAPKFNIDPKRFMVTGYGETKPIASNDTEEGKQKNRRTEIIILK